MVASRILRWRFKIAVGFVILLLLLDYLQDFKYIIILINLGQLKDSYKSYSIMKQVINDEMECPKYTIKNTTYNYANTSCIPHKMNKKDCYTAYKKYIKGIASPECPKPNASYLYANLCIILDVGKKGTKSERVKLKCKFHLCDGNPIRVGVLQPNYGLVIQPEFWYIARNQDMLEYVINKVISDNIRKGLDFCLISCKTKAQKIIKQALAFPPILKLMKKNDMKKHKKGGKRKMNVNIVVLDSVSRPHFYRQLHKSVHRLEKLHESNHKVYDFELFQSIAPRTFPNMRALFSGIIDVDSNDEINTYGLDSLFGRFSNLGYQTMLQEDSCWFDPWGALVTDNKHNLERLDTPEQYSERWQALQQKVRNLPIDGYGLTHLSCEVFLQYARTNQFNNPPKVCYNGHHLSEYFLNYTHKYLHSVEATQTSYPTFLYTHLNTGHETSGKRIAFIDQILSDYIEKVSKLKNTFTILLSDHGPKTTKFSQEYLMGRYEIAQAFMFMIIPKQLQSSFDKKSLKSLDTNQHRLINHADVFQMLMSLHSSKSAGLFQPIHHTRNCDSMPLYSFMTCLCVGWNKHLTDSHLNVHWIAEYALGSINNLITNSLIKSIGYGNCERLIGKRYDKIRKKESENGDIIYTFDLVIDKYRENEVFEVAVKLLKINVKSSLTEHQVDIQLLRWRRVSVYQHYAKCCDKTVNIELCICRKESFGIINPGRDIAKLLSIKSFDIETKLKFVDSKCLSLLIRHRPNVFKTYEITNFCLDRFYNVTIELKSEKLFRSSRKHVNNLLVKPWLVYYFGTVELNENFDERDVIENITFKLIDESTHPVTQL